MHTNELALCVKNELELKNPVIVYSVMIQFMREAGEDLIDQNEMMIDGRKILDWILKKGYTTKEKYNQIISNNEVWIQDLLLGFETGLLKYGECDFPSRDKAYQVIAEYISESEELRKKFIYDYCESFPVDHKEIRAGMCGSYDDENGIPICSKIQKYDLKRNTITKEQWLNKSWNTDYSFADEYYFLKDMSFEECDRLSENNEE